MKNCKYYLQENIDLLKKHFKNFFINGVLQNSNLLEQCEKEGFEKETAMVAISHFVDRPWFPCWVRNMALNLRNDEAEWLQTTFDILMKSTSKHNELKQTFKTFEKIIKDEITECINMFIVAAFCWDKTDEGEEFWINVDDEWMNFVRDTNTLVKEIKHILKK